MDTAAFFSALIGAVPGLIASLVTLHLTRKSNQSLEKFKTDLQQNVIQFTKWHEKRIEALITIHEAFCDYLAKDFTLSRRVTFILEYLSQQPLI